MQTVTKWGNSLAIRIPAAFAEALGLKEGTRVELKERSGELVIIAQRKRVRYRLEQLIDQITPENQHELIEWGKPVGKEIW
ncbi:MAG TPA: AbrB/MazE/SpoVT family DNA-binding domain-containing protein [Candidatus Binataceae bacterium]